MPGADFPDGPTAGDPLGIAYRKASAGKRKACKPAIRCRSRAQGPGPGLRRQVIDPREAACRFRRRPAIERAPTRCAILRPPDHPVDPSDNARSLAILFSLGRFQFFDAGDLTWNVEKRLGVPDRPDRPGRSLPGDSSRHGHLQSSDPGPDDRTHRRDHEQRPAEGGRAATVKLLRSIPSIQAAYQLHRNAATSAEDNTEPA